MKKYDIDHFFIALRRIKKTDKYFKRNFEKILIIISYRLVNTLLIEGNFNVNRSSFILTNSEEKSSI